MEMTAREGNRTERRDRKVSKRRHGMRVDGASVKMLALVTRKASKS